MSGDIFDFHNPGGQGATGTQCVESRDVTKAFNAQDDPKQRFIPPQKPAAPGWRSPVLGETQ